MVNDHTVSGTWLLQVKYHNVYSIIHVCAVLVPADTYRNAIWLLARLWNKPWTAVVGWFDPPAPAPTDVGTLDTARGVYTSTQTHGEAPVGQLGRSILVFHHEFTHGPSISLLKVYGLVHTPWNTRSSPPRFSPSHIHVQNVTHLFSVLCLFPTWL